MTSVRAANGGNAPGVAGRSQPVVHGGADLASGDRRLARAMMAGDEEDEACTAGNRLLETAVDRLPGTIETHAVEVDGPVGRYGAGSEPLVPAAV
jgi:hypothetical protein